MIVGYGIEQKNDMEKIEGFLVMNGNAIDWEYGCIGVSLLFQE